MFYKKTQLLIKHYSNLFLHKKKTLKGLSLKTQLKIEFLLTYNSGKIAVTLAKITLKKALFTLLKNKCTRKAWIAAFNQTEGTSEQSQHTNVKLTLRRALAKCYCATLQN